VLDGGVVKIEAGAAVGEGVARAAAGAQPDAVKSRMAARMIFRKIKLTSLPGIDWFKVDIDELKR
jgi:hypothetical protein